MMRALELGASLYVPATRPDLALIGNRVKHPHLRSVIFCTEDAVHARDVSLALANLKVALPRFEPSGLLRFVRVRNPATLDRVLQFDHLNALTGFVLPKVTRRNVTDYFDVLGTRDFQVMVTLETADVFEIAEMTALRDLLLHEPFRSRVASLRLGGNDLLQLLGLRRPRHRSIYATPLGPLIARLVPLFRPHGLNLTAPVFEFLDRDELLARETRRDVAQGLFGKSAIHPEQIPVIEAEYRVTRLDLQDAEMVLAEDAPAVFRHNSAMCEPATHRVWAQLIVERARLYGVKQSSGKKLEIRKL